MTGLFLTAIFSVPIVQLVHEYTGKQQVQEGSVFQQLPTVENLHAYEKELERSSATKQFIQPRLQFLLSGCLGVGNTKVVLGCDGWLFYRPDVDFLTAPGLLDETRLAQRKKELVDAGEKSPSPDPRPAILAFAADCRKAGVHLVVVPVPDKAMLQPAQLTTRLACAVPGPALANCDYDRLLQELRAAGVDVFDPTPPQLGADDLPRFLHQDTHWTPHWMETVSRDLAVHVQDCANLRANPAPLFSTHELTAGALGDLVEMLKLPSGQTMFRPEAVTLRQVLDLRTGQGWHPQAGADVLVLGDSFSNIYCAPELGWETSAGFPAQLARFLNRDVDVIARNGSGASGTRRELAQREAPLIGKRVVIWEFAVRDLLAENWAITPMPASPADEPPTSAPVDAEPIVIEATVEATSRVPEPYTVPYKDCLTYVKVRVDHVTEGDYKDSHAIVVLWGMKDNILLPAAHYSPGHRMRVRMVPLRQATLDLRTVRSADDLDDYEHRPYFVLQEEGF